MNPKAKVSNSIGKSQQFSIEVSRNLEGQRRMCAKPSLLTKVLTAKRTSKARHTTISLLERIRCNTASTARSGPSSKLITLSITIRLASQSGWKSMSLVAASTNWGISLSSPISSPIFANYNCSHVLSQPAHDETLAKSHVEHKGGTRRGDSRLEACFTC